MLLDGAEIPRSDASRWRSLAIDRGRGNKAFARTLLGQAFYFDIVENLEANEVTLKPRGGKTEGEVWTVERSTVTRKARNPNPKKRADWGRQIRLHDSFRLMRELPR